MFKHLTNILVAIFPVVVLMSCERQGHDQPPPPPQRDHGGTANQGASPNTVSHPKEIPATGASVVAQPTPVAGVSTTAKDIVALRALLTGLQAESKKDFEDSLKAFAASLQDDPESMAARMGAAWSCFNRSQFNEAARYYGSVVGSRTPDAKLWQAHALACAGEFKDAEAAYSQRASMLPYCDGGWTAPGVSTADAALVYWRRVSKKHDDQAVPWFVIGHCLSTLNRNEEATAAFRECLRRSPDFTAAQLSLVRHLTSQEPATAIRTAQDILKQAPDHFGALIALTRVSATPSAESTAASAWHKISQTAGVSVPTEHLVEMATFGWQKGDDDLGAAAVNLCVLRKTDYARVSLGDTDISVAQAAARAIERDGKRYFAKYALASGVEGVLHDLDNSNMFTIAAGMEPLRKLNLLSAEDLRKAQKQSEAITERAALANIGGMMSDLLTAQLQPYHDRCVRYLDEALSARPDFHAARVLRAQVIKSMGRDDEARAELVKVLKADPNAISIRARLIDWSSLDQRQELVEGTTPAATGDVRLMLRRAQFGARTGDHQSCISECVALTRAHGAYWDSLELLAISLSSTGKRDDALAILEYTFPLGRSAAGAVERARLRDRLSKPGACEAAIDAWRFTNEGSAEEAEARELCHKRDARQFFCARCGGGGTISVTDVSGSTYISSSTRQAKCPQCLGLGLWHAGVLP